MSEALKAAMAKIAELESKLAAEVDYSRRLRRELRLTHQRLRDANRGAERSTITAYIFRDRNAVLVERVAELKATIEELEGKQEETKEANDG